MKTVAARALMARLRAIFPDREFFVRSQGQVRFIKISTRVQALGALALVLMLGAWVATMASMALSHWSAGRQHSHLLQREAQVASAQKQVQTDRQEITSVAADLARRQEFIQRVVEAHLGEVPENAGAEDSAAGNPPTAKISVAIPDANALARLAADQLALVERLTRYADRRSARAEEAMRKLGLNPKAVLASARAEAAAGGPLQRLATSRDGSLDPRFSRLGTSLARMDALVSSLASVPQVQPAHVAFVSSSFGYRTDPFTGSAAFHAGLDFPGPMGSPIYAAAKGTVTFVGEKQGYGNCIEISHGNGLMTRYAHLSGFGIRQGQEVETGARIGALGSSGRSTGPHLHFEVRLNDKPVNPRTFLEAARHAQEDQPHA